MLAMFDYPNRRSTVIHHTTTLLEGETQHWVSLDGEDWLPVSRGPSDDDREEDVQRLFDGDGNFMPLRFARRWLAHEGATFDDRA